MVIYPFHGTLQLITPCVISRNNNIAILRNDLKINNTINKQFNDYHAMIEAIKPASESENLPSTEQDLQSTLLSSIIASNDKHTINNAIRQLILPDEESYTNFNVILEGFTTHDSKMKAIAIMAQLNDRALECIDDNETFIKNNILKVFKKDAIKIEIINIIRDSFNANEIEPSSEYFIKKTLESLTTLDRDEPGYIRKKKNIKEKAINIINEKMKVCENDEARIAIFK